MNKINTTLVLYQNLLPVSVYDMNEPFIDVNDIGIKKRKILVRKTVAIKLQKADRALKALCPTWELYVTCGYRSLEMQTMKFQKTLIRTIRNGFIPNPIDLYEQVHEQIAVPTVAGHPTGGAIDVYIMDTKTNIPVDFGSKIYDYTTNLYPTFEKGISKKAKQNRMMLRRVMMKAGFAPYDGEWWHFSYGDREWAYYYGKKNALYKQISVPEIKKLITCSNK